jgi:hypothetical protein
MKFSTRKIEDVVIIDVEGMIILGDGDVEIKMTVDDLLSEAAKKSFLIYPRFPIWIVPGSAKSSAVLRHFEKAAVISSFSLPTDASSICSQSQSC